MAMKPPFYRSLPASVLLLIFHAAGFAQFPPIRLIDFYGLRTNSEAAVLAKSGIKAGDDAFKTIASTEEIKQRLKTLPNVEDAAVSIVCCDDAEGRSMAFIGIREKGSPALEFRPAPKGTVRLPAEIVKAGDDLEAANMKAVEARDFSEDDSRGYALFGNREVRAVQERLITLAAPNLKILRRVLRDSSDAKQRALAAEVIAYTADKRSIVPDLAYAMTDPDGGTRNNATRALIILAKYARAHPEMKLNIPTLPMVRLLNSLVWTDRNKSAGALDELTVSRDPRLLNEIKTQALESLAEMARWKNRGHAHAAFNILARLAGLPEAEIPAARNAPDRDRQVRNLLQKAGSGTSRAPILRKSGIADS